MSQIFLVNQTHAVQLVYFDSRTNDSYEQELLSESNTYRETNVIWLENDRLLWVCSFLVNQTHTVQVNQCSQISKYMTLLSQIFLVNHTHAVQPLYSDSLTNDSYELELLVWIKHIHVNHCDLVREWLSLMSLFFLVNQT